MATNRIKCIQPYFDSIYIGEKTFEVRLNDRNYQVGDIVFIYEYNAATDKYSGSYVTVMIKYLLKDYPALKDGYCIFGFDIVDQGLV